MEKTHANMFFDLRDGTAHDQRRLTQHVRRSRETPYSRNRNKNIKYVIVSILPLGPLARHVSQSVSQSEDETNGMRPQW
jgi:hypothetical protein